MGASCHNFCTPLYILFATWWILWDFSASNHSVHSLLFYLPLVLSHTNTLTQAMYGSFIKVCGNYHAVTPIKFKGENIMPG